MVCLKSAPEEHYSGELNVERKNAINTLFARISITSRTEDFENVPWLAAGLTLHTEGN
jgi:hypothetical protein